MEISIRAHTRRGKNGKTVNVHGYTRRVGRKGIRSPKREKHSEGEELKAKIEQRITATKPKYTGPRMTKAERDAWDKAARKAMENYRMGKPVVEEEPKPNKIFKQKPRKKSSGVLEKLEDRIARMVEKRGVKYRRVF